MRNVLGSIRIIYEIKLRIENTFIFHPETQEPSNFLCEYWNDDFYYISCLEWKRAYHCQSRESIKGIALLFLLFYFQRKRHRHNEDVAILLEPTMIDCRKLKPLKAQIWVNELEKAHIQK